MNNEERWWLVEGVIVEIKDSLYYISECLSAGIYPVKYYGHKMKPRGVPFDCMPEWAESVTFYSDGSFYYAGENGQLPSNDEESIPYKKCPIEFKPTEEDIKNGDTWKTFKITDELRELIK